MRKLIAGINMTLDGFCDHTAIEPDEEIHNHYADLLNEADAVLYGRTTYQLMQYWQDLVSNPSGDKSMDDFAIAMDKISKVVFSQTLKNLNWESARLATGSIEEEILELKHQPGRDILVGSPSLIVASMNLNLVDELQLCVHPVLAGKGLPLFKNINNGMNLNLQRTKVFAGGAVIGYYMPKNAN